ncbi:hypothetical protein G9A89_007387 [Geosiphon pyriformis]|nr:hypothetical protein G9A89_007387 [Geosiphon pyriformis]
MDPRLVRTFMLSVEDPSNAESISTTSAIVKVIREGQATFLSLVQVLGEYLTHEDASIRAKGTALLSAVLSDCPREKVNSAAVNVLVDFYCDRLDDTPSVPQLLKGLIVLHQFETFSGENAIKLSNAIFESVKVQSLPQTNRHLVFQILDGILRHHLNALKKMGSQFVFGFIQVMDGEKDPRNLLLAFSLVAYIISNFDISDHVEDLFEVTFCYFPITFKPPPDDVYGITADDLKIGLRDCLSATPHFATHAMPFLLEKLTSNSENAKKDSLEALAVCAPVYGANALKPYLEDLWDGLKAEIFNGTGGSLQLLALEAIRSIVSSLSSEIVTQSDLMERFLQSIVSDCMENINEPELKLAKPSGLTLKYCIMASDPACSVVISSSVNRLFERYQKSELTTQKKSVLEILLQFIEASRTLYGTINNNDITPEDQDFVSPLLTYKDEYLGIFTSVVIASNEYSQFRLTGLRGLHSMILLREFLTNNEIGVVLQYFNKILLTETEEEEIVSEALNSLSNIARYKPAIVLEITFPDFLGQLPNDYKKLSSHIKKSYNIVLKALTRISIEPLLFQALVSEVMQKLDRLNSSNNSCIEYSEALLATLHTVLSNKTALKHSDISHYVSSLVPYLITKSVGPTMQGDIGLIEKKDSVFLDLKILRLVAEIISIVTRNLNTDEQAQFIRKNFQIYVHGDIGCLPFSTEERDGYIGRFQPLSAESEPSQQNLVTLFTAAVSYIRPEVQIPVAKIADFLSKIIKISLTTENKNQHTSLAKLAASIINKWMQEQELKHYVESKIIGDLWNQVTSNFEIESSRRVSLALFSWLTKALILRADEMGYRCTGNIINQFGDILLGKQASEGFYILINDDDILSKESFANIKLLYKQRFFNYSLPILVNGFKFSNDEVKHHYLFALSHLLCNVPKQVFLSELLTLFPMLVHSLSLPNPELKRSTIDTFYMIAQDAPQIISEYITTLVPLLLSLTQMTETNTMRVRIAALRCLGILTETVRFDVLYSFKNDITRELSKVLDDKKRLVRREAVDCRNKWFLFTGPKSD